MVVLIFGTTVLFQAVREPDDFVGHLPTSPEAAVTRPPQEDSSPTEPPAFNPLAPGNVPSLKDVAPKILTTPQGERFVAPAPQNPPGIPYLGPRESPALTPSRGGDSDQLTKEMASQIGEFVMDWVTPSKGTRKPEYQFTAYLGRYAGGNWNSTVRTSGDQIEAGSLPNLLYLMSHWSNDRIKTNYKSVKAIALDSEEIFVEKPPFLFLTGTRDFRLTDKEVENLRKYIRSGGCIWGDGSLPGKRSRFDLAFRREMRRVIPDLDKDFELLSDDHPIFTNGYFSKIRSTPAGLNHYRDPVQVLRFAGEIAVIYTSNDYGDMWQIGLDKEGAIDFSRDEKNRSVAINETLYAHRGTYIRNLEPEAIKVSFEFGTNVVIHLLTRWQSRLRAPAAL